MYTFELPDNSFFKLAKSSSTEEPSSNANWKDKNRSSVVSTIYYCYSDSNNWSCSLANHCYSKVSCNKKAKWRTSSPVNKREKLLWASGAHAKWILSNYSPLTYAPVNHCPFSITPSLIYTQYITICLFLFYPFTYFIWYFLTLREGGGATFPSSSSPVNWLSASASDSIAITVLKESHTSESTA